MNCPVCKKEMWDNTGKKLSPNAPDYKCKDKTCRFSLDPDTQEYVPSDYVTAVWLPKEKPKKNNTPIIDKMELDYLKEIVSLLTEIRDQGV